MTGVVSRDVHVFLADLVVCGLQDVLVLELEVSVDVLAGHEYAVWISGWNVAKVGISCSN